MEFVHSMFWFGGIGIFLIVIGSCFESIKIWFPIMSIGSVLFGKMFTVIPKTSDFNIFELFGIPSIVVDIVYWTFFAVIAPFIFKFAKGSTKSRRWN